MMTCRVIVFLLLASGAVFAAEEPVNPKVLFKAADVVLEVIPIKARPVNAGTVVDAVEGDASHMAVAEAMVTFKIRRVLKGKWDRIKAGGPSRLEQAHKALKDKNYAEILTLHFSDPNREIDKEWVSVAVEDPGKSFGITSWEDPEPKRSKIYLQRIPNRPDSYLLIGAVPA